MPHHSDRHVLSSEESQAFAMPRNCRVTGTGKSLDGVEYFTVELIPPIPAASTSLAYDEIKYVAVASREKEASSLPPKGRSIEVSIMVLHHRNGDIERFVTNAVGDLAAP